MPSRPTDVERPKPQQKRSSRRVAEYLEVAATLFAEVGYEAATMTTIAERAGSSIGGLYRYFPDKQTLAVALQERYHSDADALWAPVLKELKEAPIADFADYLMDYMVKFASDRPGYFTLLAAPIQYRRDAQSRSHLRSQIGKAFLSKKPSLSQEEALLAANVAIQMIKGMLAVCAEVEARRRAPIIREFKRAMTNYLTDVLKRVDCAKPLGKV
jgi:AcrR family transcriptional regulator